MHLYQGEDINAANTHFTRTSASVSNGVITITRKIYFESDGMNEGPVDIAKLEMFPKMYSAHPLYSNYKYYGNANIDSVINTPERSVWCAELEYSTTNSNATDNEGAPVTSETPPWKLKPDNISFSFPEVVVPFEVGYASDGLAFAVNISKEEEKKSDQTVRGELVANSAGDPMLLNRSVHNIQMDFTYAVKSGDWKIGNLIDYNGSINIEDVEVCGIRIPAYKALLVSMTPTYVTTYNDDGTKKWEYWSINVSIQIDLTGHLLCRKVLNVGNRAKFKELDLSKDSLLEDAGILAKFAADEHPSQICCFRKTVKHNSGYIPTGDLVFCGWRQFVAVKQAYDEAVVAVNEKEKKRNSVKRYSYDPQCEQLTQMPLNMEGYLLGKAILGYKQNDEEYDENAKYLYIKLREHPVKSWNTLNIPKKGIQW